MKKKRIVNGIVHQAAVDVLLENRNYTAPDLKIEVEKVLKTRGYNYSFTVRTYLNLKNEILPYLGSTPIDSVWSIGSCVKYNIPAEFISILLNEQNSHLADSKDREISYKKLFPNDDQTKITEFSNRALLTIRQAIWFVKLYPFINELAKKQYPDNTRLQTGTVTIFAKRYAHKEMVAEVLGKGTPNITPDTSDIDKLLVSGDISPEVLADSILDYTWSDEMKNKDKQRADNFTGYTHSEYEQILGKLTNKQVNLLNEWIPSILKGAVYRREWEKEHPEIIELVKSAGGDFSSLIITLESNRQQKDGEK